MVVSPKLIDLVEMTRLKCGSGATAEDRPVTPAIVLIDCPINAKNPQGI